MAVIVVPVLCVTSTGSQSSWSCSVSASPDSSLFYTACRQPVMLSLCSVTTRSVQPCVATTVSYITQKKVLFATRATPVPRYTRPDLLSLETAATPPPSFLSPQLIARLSHLGIAINVPRKPRRSRRGGNNNNKEDF